MGQDLGEVDATSPDFAYTWRDPESGWVAVIYRGETKAEFEPHCGDNAEDFADGFNTALVEVRSG